MTNLKKKLRNIIELISELTNIFYQQDNEKGYQKLDIFLEEMTIVVDNLFQYKENHKEFILDDAKLISNFTEAMNALEQKDTVLLADILQYEILEQLNQIANQLEY